MDQMVLDFDNFLHFDLVELHSRNIEEKAKKVTEDT